MSIEKNFQIVRLETEQAKRLIEMMQRLGDEGGKGVKGFDGAKGIEGGKGPSGSKCSHTNVALEPIGRADFECEDSD